MRRGARALGAALVAATLLGAAPVAASGRLGATGDAHAIEFYRASANATNALPAYVIEQSGYVRIIDSIGSSISINWAWGSQQWQPGYYPARERLVLVQSKGRTDWIEDTLIPVRGACRTSCKHVFPLQFFITRGGAFAGIALSGTKAPCFQHEALSRVPYGVGTRWWFAVGRFSPLVRHGALTTVTSRYPDDGQHEVEVDTAGTRTHLFVHSTFRVARAGRTRGFTFHQSDVVLGHVPRPPALEICS